MTRLEFIGLKDIEELKTIMNKLAKGEEHTHTYKDSDGNQKTKIVCKNGRLYLGSNYSISYSQGQDGRVFLGVDYFSSEDRVKLNQNKPTTTNVF